MPQETTRERENQIALMRERFKLLSLYKSFERRQDFTIFCFVLQTIQEKLRQVKYYSTFQRPRINLSSSRFNKDNVPNVPGHILMSIIASYKQLIASSLKLQLKLALISFPTICRGASCSH